MGGEVVRHSLSSCSSRDDPGKPRPSSGCIMPVLLWITHERWRRSTGRVRRIGRPIAIVHRPRPRRQSMRDDTRRSRQRRPVQ
jgi:hypothetical protein